jgi:hypothetical protein
LLYRENQGWLAAASVEALAGGTDDRYWEGRMHPRLTISGMMAVVVLAAVGFAAMRSGSGLWLRVIYSLVAMALLTATVLARYRGAFWYGFAVFGWGYFLLGLGPWDGLSYDIENYICSLNDNYQHG